MIKIRGLDHIVLRTNQLQAMLHFYVDILGCVVEREQPKFRLTQLRVGSNLIDLIEVDSAPAMENPNLAHFCLQIENENDFLGLENYFNSHDIKLDNYGKRYGAAGETSSFYLHPFE